MLDNVKRCIEIVYEEGPQGFRQDPKLIVKQARAEVAACEALIEAANAECDTGTIRTVAALVALKRLQGRQSPEGK